MENLAKNISIDQIVVEEVDIIIQIIELNKDGNFNLLWSNNFFKKNALKMDGSKYNDSSNINPNWNPAKNLNLNEAIEKITMENKNYDHIYKYNYKTKSSWYYANIAPFRYNEDGDLTQIICAVIDLTDKAFNPERYNDLKKELDFVKNEIHLSKLSKTETIILKHLGSGKSEKEIAHILARSTHTIKVHLKNIRKKLNLSKNTLLVKFAIEAGIL